MRGSSLPLDAMLGVAMERESEMPVCASIRCKASSVQIQYSRLGERKRRQIQEVPMRKILNSGLRRVRALTEVLKMQSNTMDGFPTGKKRNAFQSSYGKQKIRSG